MTNNTIEEIIEKLKNLSSDEEGFVFSGLYATDIQKVLSFVRQAFLKVQEEARKDGIQTAIELSDKIEMSTPGTEFEEWRAFKHFRNTLRDLLTPPRLTHMNDNVFKIAPDEFEKGVEEIKKRLGKLGLVNNPCTNGACPKVPHDGVCGCPCHRLDMIKNTPEDLKRLSQLKEIMMSDREEVCDALDVVSKMKGCDYVVELLINERERLTKEIEETHNKMFPNQ